MTLCPSRTIRLLVVVLAGAACFDDATSPSGAVIVDVALAPQAALIPSPADRYAQPVNRIHSVTTDAGSGSVLDDRVVEVSPTDAQWELLITVPAGRDPASVIVTAYLIHVTQDATESIEFSGRTSPLVVEVGKQVSPDLPLVRGPLVNLYTTSVTILSAPTGMTVGSQATVTGTGTTSMGVSPTIFWTSLDPDLVTLAGASATAVAPGTARVVASAGAFADTALISVISGGAATLLGSWNPQLGSLVSAAFDPVSTNLFLYGEFASELLEHTQAGAAVPPAILLAGRVSNDIDLDFLPVGTTIGATQVPTGSLLIVNGEVLPALVTAVDKGTGAAYDSIPLASGTGNPVGGAFHPKRGTLFSVDWTTDVISEINLSTGGVVSSFSVQPSGPPPFDAFYGDVDVDQETGNVILVSSSQSVVRVLSPTGAWVADYDVGALGILQMSGIAWDDATRTAWIVSTTGDVYHVGGIG